MHTLFQDVRYGIRMLLKRPGFTVVAVLALALGIGANSAIFSVINAVLLKPLPYHEPDRIFSVMHPGPNPVAPANYFDWKAQSQSFEAMAATQWWQPTLTGRDEPEQLRAVTGTADLFRVFGVVPLLGRAFLPDEDHPGNDRVVVISHGLWQHRFGGDPGIIGQSLILDGDAYAVIGVMPAGYKFVPFWAAEAELCVPLVLADRRDDRGGQSLRVFARIRPGITEEQAQAEMTTIMSRLEQQYPDVNTGRTVSVDSIHTQVVGNIRLALLVLSGAVGFVLLIACANVANLLLGRTLVRRREIAVRMAIGASRRRVVRQLLTESLLLALLGGIGGLLLALWGVDVLVAMSPASIPRVETVRLDAWALGFTFAVSAVTGVAFGLIPALQASRDNMSASMKEGGRSAGEGQLKNRFRSLLVVSEVALTLLLLIGAGLMMRSFLQLQRIDPGLNPENLLTMTVSVAGSNQAEAPRRAAFYRQLIDETASLPEVRSVSAINHLPLGGDLWRLAVVFEGRPAPVPGERVGAAYRVVLPGYFQTMDIRLRRGRDFRHRDDLNAPGVVIINETMARRHFPGEDPIGKRIAVGNPQNPEWLSIIGVVRDVRQGGWAEVPENEVYLSYLHHRDYLMHPASRYQYMTLVVRTTGDPLRPAASIRQAAWAIDKNVPVSQVASMERIIFDQLWQSRFSLFLFTVFAGVAIILAAVGLYGVMAYAVAQRTHEIGIRMALGAQRRDVLKLAVGQGMILTGLGVVIGMAGAAVLTQVMTAMLYEVSATDPVTFGLGAATLILVALLASYVPARRATRVDPIVALRHE